MKTSVLALLAFTALSAPALAQPAVPPSLDGPQAVPPGQTNPQQPGPGAMMCGAQASQQGQGRQGGCSCCSGMAGQPQRQGGMPMHDHSRMAQMHQGQSHDQGHTSGTGSTSHNHQALGAQPTDTPATRAFHDVNARMHKDMTMGFTNDVDVDFVRGMIPHHVGAVEMAKVALQHSKDPEIRKLAEEVIKAQEVEITHMRAFLKRKGVE